MFPGQGKDQLVEEPKHRKDGAGPRSGIYKLITVVNS
jgi:hypothetical protein